MKVLFLNNKKFSPMGWFVSEKYLGHLFESFDRLNVEHEYVVVESATKLENILKEKKFDLVMPNMYNIRDGEKIVWVPKILEDNNIPVIGPSSKTLENLLEKNKTQTILKNKGIMVPNFAVIDNSNIQKIEEILYLANVKTPVIVKPTNSASSKGISKKSIRTDYTEVAEQARYIMDKFGGKAQVEEYIKGKEITVGILKNGTKITSFQTYTDNSKRLRYDDGLPTGMKEEMTIVEDQEMINKLSELAGNVYDVLNIRDITRFDSMIDNNGVPHVIDVNGMPGLSLNNSYTTRQIYTCYPQYSVVENYDKLIGTILYFAAKRLGVSNHNIKEKNLLPLREINNN